MPRLRFSNCELWPLERRLLVDGVPAPLGSRAMEVLLAMVERPGELVTKQQLLDRVWAGSVVDENNLPRQVSSLRKVLGPQVILTVAGRGYRFAAQVVALSSDQAAPPPAPQPSTLRTNLPADLPRLLGREADLLALDRGIGEQRLVSIVGPGGMGKTLLAQHLLAGRLERYAHGVCWVELAALPGPEAVCSAVAAALGVRLGDGDPQAGLCHALAPLSVLVALDNAEHVLEAVAELARALLQACPGLQLVVTSQAPLRVPGEHVVRLEPLSVPEGPVTVAQALSYSALALLVQRAQAADARFRLTDANVLAAVHLCRALDGIPLAIELAAARVQVLGLQQLAESLPERLAVLTANANRWAPSRQQTLRAMVEWSHESLAARERLAFRRLGAVIGSASLPLVASLVQQTTPPDGPNQWSALDALQVLVERSLAVVVAEPAPDGVVAMRYRLLESPRALALEYLLQAGEMEATSRAHAWALAAQFERAWSDLWDGRVGVEHWQRALAPDLDNARGAFAWASAHGESVLALQIGRSLLWALPKSAHAECMALARACEALASTDLPEPLRLTIWLSTSATWINAHPARSQAATQQALSLARALKSSADGSFWLYMALSQAVFLSARRGERDAALGGLAEMQALEDPAWPAQRLLLGCPAKYSCARLYGEPSRALAITRRNLSLRQAAGADVAVGVSNLIDAEVAAGEAQAAVRTGRFWMPQIESSRDAYSVAYVRLNLSGALLAVGEVGPARTLAQTGWRSAQQFDQVHFWADHLALLAALEGRPRSASRVAGYADGLYRHRHSSREGNEAKAFASAQALAERALGAAEAARLRSEGAWMSDEEVGRAAFAAEDY